MDETIGARLKRYRKASGLTQEQLATTLEINLNTYVRYENDLRKPSTENALKLSLFYHISMAELMRGEVQEGNKELEPDPTLLILTRGLQDMTADERKHFLDVVKVIFPGRFNQ